jgi:hypothetical protein
MLQNVVDAWVCGFLISSSSSYLETQCLPFFLFVLPNGLRYQLVWIDFRDPETIMLLVSCVVPVYLV